MAMDAGKITVRLELDTRSYDKAMRRLRRRTLRRYRGYWLWVYAAAITGVAITLAAILVVRG